jgi:hypothetical protein
VLLPFLCVQAGYEDDMIDNAIEDEFNENEQSFNPKQYQQRAGGVATATQ